MMGRLNHEQEQFFYSFRLDDVVPGDHPVRRIAAVLDLGWVYSELTPYYPRIGRPSVDPVLMIRMLIVGYVFGIRSERVLCRDVAVNLAYRLFCGLSIEDKVPDHSVFSRARNERRAVGRIIERGQILFDRATSVIRIDILVPLRAGNRTMLIGISLNQAGVHRKAFTADETGRDAGQHNPLEHMAQENAWFEIYNSPLSEASVLGFEYGFSRDFPEALVLWEAQFGDFANGAQIIIDQFIAASEDKWNLLSGVVMLLPHGYEGQGPEHSSARIERFLQLAARDNIQICQPSTAAQYFHLLRRQALRSWRKPLVVFTPKSMLRNPAASSTLADLAVSRFRNVIPDKGDGSAERVLLCTGKIGHELEAERKRHPENAPAIVFVEQLYPFPEDEVAAEMDRHAKATEFVWVQEEPGNMGAHDFVIPELERLSRGRSVLSVNRSAAASPATGSAKAHEMEQKTLISVAFGS